MTEPRRSAAAERARRHRARRRHGIAIFQIEAPPFDLADALVAAGWLAAWDSDDRAAVEKALAAAVRAMVDDA